ncbi:hypothetical protein QFZ77_004483 [Paenibacillus sp. V4I3]|uniref:hypothetical protein n=1 Tax=unclassified Paenibacillus TaxID=185978 RepID=UPI0027813495|nr:MULTISPECIES: hypothetical protein [unclassified Paenibacillus]MDQ0875824.1 hypothetical protein [Paenibacillus sp. V4I3]MDQ0888106.1 hypothetical protein [Paenibacillus sp. V4I9]
MVQRRTIEEELAFRKILFLFIGESPNFKNGSGDLKSSGKYFRDRARSFNNKGLVNEYRKPKQSYREVRDVYQSWGDEVQA